MSDELNSNDQVLPKAGIELLCQRIDAATKLDENLTAMEADIHARQNTLNKLLIKHIFACSTITRQEFFNLVNEHHEKLRVAEKPTEDREHYTQRSREFDTYVAQYYHDMKRGVVTDYSIYLNENPLLNQLDEKEFPKRYAKEKEHIVEGYLDAVRKGERQDTFGLVVTEEQALAQIKAVDKLVFIDALNTHAQWLKDCFDAVHRETPKPQVDGLGALVQAAVLLPTLCVSAPFAREIASLQRHDAPTSQANTSFYREMQQWHKDMIAAVGAGVMKTRAVTEDRLDDVLLNMRVQAMASMTTGVSAETVEGLIEMEKETALKSPFAMFLREQGLLGISGHRLDVEAYIRQHNHLRQEFKSWLILNPGAEEGAAQKPEDALFAIPADERYEFYCKQFDRYAKMVDIESVTEQVQEMFVVHEKRARNAKAQGLS